MAEAKQVVDQTRISVLNNQPRRSDGKAVVYWMSKDQRPTHNWALTRAIELGNELQLPVVVLFVVASGLKDTHMQLRHMHFMLHGLADTAQQLRRSNVGFVMRRGVMAEQVTAFIDEVEAAIVVTDQCYLRSGQRWRRQVAAGIEVAMEAVDATTVVPPRVAADKQQVGAYTLRPKLRKVLDTYLVDQPSLMPQVAWEGSVEGLSDQKPDEILKTLKLRRDADPVALNPGPTAAQTALNGFIEHGIADYGNRNDPAADVSSKLSAYLHYGQLSAQQIAFDLQNSEAVNRYADQVDEFLDELITWRELAVNYCRYHNSYDRLSGAPQWARDSLQAHIADERPHIYSFQQLRDAQTGDALWNAAQKEMLKTGRMHGYMRMYWGKKLLEWTETPQTAVDIARHLNDTYELDGRDPNGYAGILWAIGGLHDRPWFEREIFGKVRYMNYNGAKRKFDIDAYIERIERI